MTSDHIKRADAIVGISGTDSDSVLASDFRTGVYIRWLARHAGECGPISIHTTADQFAAEVVRVDAMKKREPKP